MNIFQLEQDSFNVDKVKSICFRQTIFNNDFYNFCRHYKLNKGNLIYFWSIDDMILVYITADDCLKYLNFLLENNYKFNKNLLSNICVLNKNINSVEWYIKNFGFPKSTDCRVELIYFCIKNSHRIKPRNKMIINYIEQESSLKDKCNLIQIIQPQIRSLFLNHVSSNVYQYIITPYLFVPSTEVIENKISSLADCY